MNFGKLGLKMKIKKSEQNWAETSEARHYGEDRLHRPSLGKLLKRESDKSPVATVIFRGEGRSESRVARIYYLKCPRFNKKLWYMPIIKKIWLMVWKNKAVNINWVSPDAGFDRWKLQIRYFKYLKITKRNHT